MNIPTRVMLFANGNVATFNSKGEQIPELQNSLYDYPAMLKLAKAIIKNNIEVERQGFVVFPPLDDYLKFYRENPTLLEDTK